MSVGCVLALPSPAASSTMAAGTSEEEGLHACPLPHNFEVAFYLVSGDFGGGRIGTFSLPPHNVGEYFGGGGTGPPPHNVRKYFGGEGTGPSPHNDGVYFMVEENDEPNVSRPQTYTCGYCRGRSSSLSEMWLQRKTSSRYQLVTLRRRACCCSSKTSIPAPTSASRMLEIGLMGMKT